MFSRKMCGLPKAEASPLPPTPQQPLSVYSGSNAFVTNESPNGNGSPYAGSQMLSSYQDSGSLLGGSASDKASRSLNCPLPVTPVQNLTYPYQQNNTMLLNAQALQQIPMEGLLWDPAIYPQSFPAPWFALPKGAGTLYQPVNETPAYLPPVPGIFTAETGYVGMPLNGYQADRPQFTPVQPTASMQEISPSQATRQHPDASRQQQPAMPVLPPAYNQTDQVPSDSRFTAGQKERPHKAWGVDIKRAPVQLALDRAQHATQTAADSDDAGNSDDEPVVVGPDGPFPPGISLQRCATAAHSVVRLEVLHRSATLAMWKGP